MPAIAYWMPKGEAADHEWEDGAAYSEPAWRAAVADGASASFDAQRWAAALCTAFCTSAPRTFDPEAFESWIDAIAGAWPGAPDARDAPDAPEAGGAPDADRSAWYVGEAARRGSFATFCGVQVRRVDDRLRWHAVAVGDACLFHVRDGSLLRAFPVDRPDGFTATPALVTSLPWGGDHGARHLQVATGDAVPGDLLLLATDALAQWALGRQRDVGDAWATLERVDQASLRAVVHRLRAEDEIVDDDVTLLRWRLDG